MAAGAKSQRDDPTTPRYVMSGFYTKICGFLAAAAIDARQRTCPRWHDMAASASLKREKMPITLLAVGLVAAVGVMIWIALQ